VRYDNHTLGGYDGNGNRMPAVKLDPLRAVEDMKQFLFPWQALPRKHVHILCDFEKEANDYVRQMKMYDGNKRWFLPTHGNGSNYTVEPFSTLGLQTLFEFDLPTVPYVTRTVIHFSCHGNSFGFILPIESISPECKVMKSAEFTTFITEYGKRRKLWWDETHLHLEGDRLPICHPLHLTVYLDACHSGDFLPLKWTFSIKNNGIKRCKSVSVDANKPNSQGRNSSERELTALRRQGQPQPATASQGQFDETSPEKCHMSVVCLAACGLKGETIDFKGSGLFTRLLNYPCPVGPTNTKVTLNKIVVGWSLYNTYTFSMVPLIWFHMNKTLTCLMEEASQRNTSDLSETGFYWSTNIECLGTDGFEMTFPTDPQKKPIWGLRL
jgi:hypothetical protein